MGMCCGLERTKSTIDPFASKAESLSNEIENETNWFELLSGDHEPSDYVEITPERVAIISLKDCFDQLERSGAEPLRLALSAKSAHLAMQAALTAAIAGSANIGAHPEKLRLQHLAHLHDRGAGKIPRPESDRVMTFGELLNSAINQPLEWSSSPLSVTEDERYLLDRLTTLRHGVEHPKQMSWYIEPLFITQTLPVAARLTVRLLEDVFHHLEAGELEELKKIAAQICELCDVRD